MSDSKLEFRQFVLIIIFNFHIVTVFSTFDTRFHPCIRPCTKNHTAMVCRYRFEIENYYVRSKACYDCPKITKDCFRPDCIPADGVDRVLTVINRQMPGPAVQVCVGDTILVDVVNSMTEESTSVHWHGHHQRRTPFMDGVPHITQCPIIPGTTFQYKIKAELPGTHFYHSHTGAQRADGLYGSLIIRQPKNEDVHGALYDYDLPEHVIITTDWIHESGAAKYASHYHSNGTNKADTILVNGLRPTEFQWQDGKKYYTPVAHFDVEQGKRYRFRIISAAVLYCPIEISVENHTLILINSDGGDIQPVHAQSFVIYAGERWDYIINANNHVDNYWIKFKGLKDCDENFNSAHAVAVLHYKGAPREWPKTKILYETMTPEGLQVNTVNVGSGQRNSKTVAELANAKMTYDPALKETADVSVVLSFDFYAIDNTLFHKPGVYGFHQVSSDKRRYIPQINHISMKMPSFPVLSEPEYITSDTFCNESQSEDCVNNFCFCSYLIELPLNATIEVTFIDEGVPYQSNHPFHLHGHSFRVVALERLGNNTTAEDVKKYDDAKLINRNLVNPPVKDTVTVPEGGFTVIRFFTTNPGYWLLHCHLDFHVEAGMAVLFKVGNVNDFPPMPENFPKCGQFYYHESRTTSVKATSGDDLRVTKMTENDDFVDPHRVSDEENESQNTVDRLWDAVKSKFTANGSSRNLSNIAVSLFISLCACFFTNNTNG